jgi:UDP-N-acetylglucosamine 4,6-dehydratase
MKYFITGITGTLGSLVCQKLLKNEENEVIGISRDECKQASFPKHKRLTLYLGDIRDKARLEEATRGVDLIFHFAALKHVDKLEENPEEAVCTNIYGTMNILSAQRTNGIKRVVLSATDKGVYPINTYGMSKGISERLVLRNPNNVVVRYGNVLASRGSVIEGLVKSLTTKATAYLTDPNMSRFWLTADEASDFVLSGAAAKEGGLKIPPMKAASLHLLVSAVAQVLNIQSYCTGRNRLSAG